MAPGQSQEEDEEFRDERSKDGSQRERSPVDMSLFVELYGRWDVRDDVCGDECDREDEELEKQKWVLQFWVIFMILNWNKQN